MRSLLDGLLDMCRESPRLLVLSCIFAHAKSRFEVGYVQLQPLRSPKARRDKCGKVAVYLL